MTKSASELARAILQAYAGKDRDAAEALIAENFHFTSPLDNALDRETYFQTCWPNSERMTACRVVQTVDLGDQAYITYEAQAADRAFRNTELHTARDGKLVAVEVYFGWNIPHNVAPGGHIDNPPVGGHP